VNGEQIVLDFATSMLANTYDQLSQRNSFVTPALPPGKYKLEVLIVPTNEMALIHGTDSIEIVDMTYCAEENAYSPGET
jgi:hypothetical protein